MLRAVVDVNVLVSAHLNAAGPPDRVHRAWLAGAFELVASPLLIDELERVVSRPGLSVRLDPLAIPILVSRLLTDALMVADPPAMRVVPDDENDDYLVALAQAGDAHVIVTGDGHLLDLEGLRPPALDPRGLLELLDRIG